MNPFEYRPRTATTVKDCSGGGAQIRKALILGVAGGFGRLFLDLLRQDGVAVSGVDLAAGPVGVPGCAGYFEADAACPGEGLLAASGGVDVLLVCLPERAAFEAFDRFIPRLAPGALVIDTLSVKDPVARRAAALRVGEGRLEWVSLNPLGAPGLGLAGRNVAAVPLWSGPRGIDFLARLERRGARVRTLSPESHDRLTALTQVATHCAILAFGMCLGELAGEEGDLEALSTPPFRTLLALWGRMLAQDPEVYWHVQRDNPFAEEARGRFVAKAQELREMLRNADQEAFLTLFDFGRGRFKDQSGAWARLAERLFRV